MEISRREVRRYLGYGKNEGDETVNALIETCIEELAGAAACRHISRAYPLAQLSDGALDLGVLTVQSKSLSRNLKDCSQVILFAATLGAGVDLLLHKYTRLQISKAVVMQAAAAAMIEEYCDVENRRIKEEYEAKGLSLRPRFSPGYGDFPLESQRQITQALETPKRIGVVLTDSLLMAPSKSVTAVIGVSEKPYRCEIKGCEVCEKADCAYRR